MNAFISAVLRECGDNNEVMEAVNTLQNATSLFPFDEFGVLMDTLLKLNNPTIQTEINKLYLKEPVVLTIVNKITSTNYQELLKLRKKMKVGMFAVKV